jgi:hypothetical protein
MLLGRDFGTKTYHNRLCGTPAQEETAITWRHTWDIYLSAQAGLPVWCTNYLMGVRKSGSSKGNIAKRTLPDEWQSFESPCCRFLQSQVLLQRPLVLVILGRYNRDDLSTVDRLVQNPAKVIRHTFSEGAEEHTAVVTFADHPHSLIPGSRREEARGVALEIGSLFEKERGARKLV